MAVKLTPVFEAPSSAFSNRSHFFWKKIKLCVYVCVCVPQLSLSAPVRCAKKSFSFACLSWLRDRQSPLILPRLCFWGGFTLAGFPPNTFATRTTSSPPPLLAARHPTSCGLNNGTSLHFNHILLVAKNAAHTRRLLNRTSVGVGCVLNVTVKGCNAYTVSVPPLSATPSMALTNSVTTSENVEKRAMHCRMHRMVGYNTGSNLTNCACTM